jgi:hypothetical protein
MYGKSLAFWECKNCFSGVSMGELGSDYQQRWEVNLEVLDLSLPQPWGKAHLRVKSRKKMSWWSGSGRKSACLATVRPLVQTPVLPKNKKTKKTENENQETEQSQASDA